ncbi:MAG: signal peptidase II [Chloroflexi bacterium]|nr:signal peptidase II [Chloroflexota bacterium]
MRKWIILAGARAATLAADQTSKRWIVSNLELYESARPIPALAPLFQFTRSSNTGAAFGILPMAGDLFLLIALLIVAGLLWHFRETRPEARLAPFAIGLVIGGAFGNMLDRLQYGHVVDFIHYQIPNVISNVSNLADHAIVLGVLLVIAESLWRENRERRPTAQADDST